jgi:hypothetical protein
MVIPFPGPPLLPVVQQVLSDEQVPQALRQALHRLATSEDLDARIEAFTELQDAALADGIDADATASVLRFFPALAAIANMRSGAEQSALFAVVGTLEMLRLAAEAPIPAELAPAWAQARATTRRAVALALAEELPAPEALRGLLCCLAALHGNVDLAEAIATGVLDDDVAEGFGDDDEDDDEDDEDDEDGGFEAGRGAGLDEGDDHEDEDEDEDEDDTDDADDADDAAGGGSNDDSAR